MRCSARFMSGDGSRSGITGYPLVVDGGGRRQRNNPADRARSFLY